MSGTLAVLNTITVGTRTPFPAVSGIVDVELADLDLAVRLRGDLIDVGPRPAKGRTRSR